MSNIAKTVLLNQLTHVLARYVEPHFKPGTQFALIALTPGNPEADVLVTDADFGELSAVIERSRARPDMPGIGPQATSSTDTGEAKS